MKVLKEAKDVMSEVSVIEKPGHLTRHRSNSDEDIPESIDSGCVPDDTPDVTGSQQVFFNLRESCF